MLASVQVCTHSLVPGAERECLVHTDALQVNLNGIAHVYDVYTVWGVCSDEI